MRDRESDSELADEDPFDRYQVVRNGNGDYSIWPCALEMPKGWEQVGIEGIRKECLTWIGSN